MLTTLKKAFVTAGTCSLLLASTFALADKNDHDSVYRVSITNLTNSINFTPILVSSHRKGVSIIKLGSAASAEITAIAEGGDISLLTTTLNENSKVIDVQNSAGLLGPGQSVEVKVSAKNGAKHISLASMMLPTNDGFIALNSVKAPKHGSITYFSPGYDAGTEINDEWCINIPGPTCGGTGPSPADYGEGFVHINRGIQGIGDLRDGVYDWRNPVAKITISRVRVQD
ncbi:MAG: spondin domain-containing protein [Thiotrichaceae bacterium]|nr:spondin domain-containing protein [Thiotrichaceae bacterium]